MNLIRWFVEAINPCVHQDRTVATMFDDPTNPKVTTVVSECELCGRVQHTVIKAAGVCTHKWTTYTRIAVFDKPDAQRPGHYRAHQTCDRCGEERAVDLMPEKGKAA